MIISKINMVVIKDYYSLKIQLKLKMFMKILVRVKKCSILVHIQLSQNILMIQKN